ncbi:MAG TPA: CrcB family protein [Actinomycetota bacterium]|nr:CrcB family protein [Actinomycetota bacterium]
MVKRLGTGAGGHYCENVADDHTLPGVPRAPGLAGQRAWDVPLVIAAGGALGGGARELLNLGLPGAGFPWATLIANVTGCFLLGLLMVFLLEVWRPGRYLRPFLGVGVLGGFTTFSAYTAETRHLLTDGRVPLGLGYFFGSVLAGLIATWLGVGSGRFISRSREAS